jgi:hypothetical protein
MNLENFTIKAQGSVWQSDNYQCLKLTLLAGRQVPRVQLAMIEVVFSKGCCA